jgi:proteasome lid subunit RPN8/RPN11
LPLFNFSKDQRAKIHSIRKRTLKMILEASKSSYPDEFGAFLRAEKGVIRELILLPGTVSGHRHASFMLQMLPIDFTIVGTVHSHPSGVCHPSEADLELFRKYGWVHIIACMPYDMNSWVCYDMNGDEKELEIVN